MNPIYCSVVSIVLVAAVVLLITLLVRERRMLKAVCTVGKVCFPKSLPDGQYKNGGTRPETAGGYGFCVVYRIAVFENAAARLVVLKAVILEQPERFTCILPVGHSMPLIFEKLQGHTRSLTIRDLATR